MNNEEFLVILKRIKALLNKNAWFEAKEYTQLEINNFETSAKTGKGVDEAFKEIVNQILDIQDKNDDEKVDERPSVKIHKDNNKDNQKKKGCC